jgi:hypothetical protein
MRCTSGRTLHPGHVAGIRDRMRTPTALLVALLALSQPVSAQVLFANGFDESLTFFEPFTWAGDHAATINHANSSGDPDHIGSTVWWNEDAWDAHGDVGYLPTAKPTFPVSAVLMRSLPPSSPAPRAASTARPMGC